MSAVNVIHRNEVGERASGEMMLLHIHCVNDQSHGSAVEQGQDVTYLLCVYHFDLYI